MPDRAVTGPLMLVALVGAHFLCDYPLQGDFLSKAKNRKAPLPGVPWYQALIAHAFIQGAGVALITGIWWLGAIEMLVHIVTDDVKCTQRIGFNTDQAIHIACRVAWWGVAMALQGGLP